MWCKSKIFSLPCVSLGNLWEMMITIISSRDLCLRTSKLKCFMFPRYHFFTHLFFKLKECVTAWRHFFPEGCTPFWWGSFWKSIRLSSPENLHFALISGMPILLCIVQVKLVPSFPSNSSSLFLRMQTFLYYIFSLVCWSIQQWT